MGIILALERCARCRHFRVCTTTGSVALCHNCAAAVAKDRAGRQLALPV